MTANAAGVAYSFKAEILQGIHNLGVGVVRSSTAADSIKAALFQQNSSIGPATTAYSTAGEVSGTGYTAGGISVPNANAPTTNGGSSAYWTPSGSLTWNGLTVSTPFDCCLFYNASQGNRAIAVFTFGAQTVSAGTFSLTMPTNAAGTALIQLS